MKPVWPMRPRTRVLVSSDKVLGGYRAILDDSEGFRVYLTLPRKVDLAGQRPTVKEVAADR